MSELCQLELRVFAGIHRGVRAPLAAGNYSLGRHPSCDFILCDAGVDDRHGNLDIQTDSWLFEPSLNDDESKMHGASLPFGIGVEIGEALITVDVVDAPWMVRSESSNVETTEATGCSDDDTVRDDAKSIDVAPVSETQHSRWRIPACIIASIAATGGLALLAVPASDPPAPPVSEITAPDSDRRLSEISAILSTQNMTDRARIIRLDDGGFRIDATVSDDAEYERLADALSRISPRPGLRVSDERELVQSIVQSVVSEEDGVVCEHLGNLRFRIDGYVASEDLRKNLPARLLAEFPAIRGLDDKRMTPLEMSEHLLVSLRGKGLSNIRSGWKDSVFFIEMPTAANDQATLTRALADADRQFGRWLSFAVRSPVPSPAAAHTEPLPAFHPNTIVGGPTPYVVLDNGQKILVGGHVGAWQLVGIDNERIRLDGPRSIALPR